MSAPRHVYVHVPFCARRCSYCDFSIAVRRHVPVDEYLDALAIELERRVPEPLEVETLYIGGGTPSLLGGDGVARLVELLFARMSLAPAAEVTLEANPDDVTLRSARAWRDAGVNRISLGAQTFDPRVLTWMHRSHRSWQVEAAVARLRGEGISRLSLDLIFALPAELGRRWESDLRRALALDPGHLSLYGLTVEPATPLARWIQRGETHEAPEERYEEEFLFADALLTAAGYDHYEVSNYARPQERSRHNSAYWLRTAYLGLGPSAHSFDGHVRRWNISAYADWAQRARTGQGLAGGEEELSGDDLTVEEIYLGLRTDLGVSAGLVPEERLERWVQEGWARSSDGRVALTARGWLRLDALAADLTLLASR